MSFDALARGDEAYAETFPVILSFEVDVDQDGLTRGAFFLAVVRSCAFDLESAIELPDLEPLGVLGLWKIMYDTYRKNIRTTHVKIDVFFGALAPHFGHCLALVLTGSPHSLHFFNAMLSFTRL